MDRLSPYGVRQFRENPELLHVIEYYATWIQSLITIALYCDNWALWRYILTYKFSQWLTENDLALQ